MMLSSACMGGVIGQAGYGLSFLLTGVLVLLVTGIFYLMIKDFSGSLASERPGPE
jgi:hypothetical protein